MQAVPVLQTDRLTIRPFVTDDFDDIRRVIDDSREGDPFIPPMALNERRAWLDLTIALTGRFAEWYSPYGDRAVILRSSNILIGAAGFDTALEPFAALPYLGGHAGAPSTPEVTLYWEIGKVWRRQGYAAEAAQALVNYAFNVLRVRRLFALTHPDNLASQGVMRKLGMAIERAQGTCGILLNKDVGGVMSC